MYIIKKNYSLLPEGEYRVLKGPGGKGSGITAMVEEITSLTRHEITFYAYLQRRFVEGNILRFNGDGTVEVIERATSEEMP